MIEDLLAFLNARLAETAARPGLIHDLGCAAVPSVITMDEGPCDCGWPARVLREVDACRVLISYALENAESIDGEWGDGHEAAEIAGGKCGDRGARAAVRILGPLAAIWSNHVDYPREVA